MNVLTKIKFLAAFGITIQVVNMIVQFMATTGWASYIVLALHIVLTCVLSHIFYSAYQRAKQARIKKIEDFLVGNKPR